MRLSFLLSLIHWSSCFCCDGLWTGSINKNWSHPGNWSFECIPEFFGDIAIFSNEGSSSVNIAYYDTQLTTLIFDEKSQDYTFFNSFLNFESFDVDPSITILNGHQHFSEFMIESSNDLTIALSSSLTLDNSVIFTCNNASLFLQGDGVINLENNSDLSADTIIQDNLNIIVDSSSTLAANLVDQYTIYSGTIFNAGSIGHDLLKMILNGGTLINQGQITCEELSLYGTVQFQIDAATYGSIQCRSATLNGTLILAPTVDFIPMETTITLLETKKNLTGNFSSIINQFPPTVDLEVIFLPKRIVLKITQK